MSTESPQHLSKFPVEPVWLLSIAVTVLMYSAGAVAVVQAPEGGMVDIVGEMFNHITVRDPVVLEASLPPAPPPPEPPPAPLPEEIPAEPKLDQVALAKKTNDQPGGNPHIPPSLNPEPVMVAVAPPVAPPKAEPPKKQAKPKPSKAAPKPKTAPKETTEPTPPEAPTPALALAAFDKSTSTTPTTTTAPENTSPQGPTAAAGSTSGTENAASAPTPAAPTALAAHGTGQGPGSGGDDAIDRKGILKEYLKEVNVAVQKNYEYPRMAMRMRLEGTALVAVTINAQGDITKAEIAQSSGHEVLDEAALAAVRALGRVPAPPPALDWSERTVKIPYRFILRQG